jgi:hypothetical protein
MSKRKQDDSDGPSMEILPLVPAGATPPKGRPYVQLCGAIPHEHLDFHREHAEVCHAFTNRWYKGNPPLLGCQGMYNLLPTTYYRLHGYFAPYVGPTGHMNRGWERSGPRAVWYSPDRVPPGLRLDADGFTKLKGAQCPRTRVLLVAPPFEGAGVIVVPGYGHEGYPGYTSIHGICSDIDYAALTGPKGDEALRAQDLKDRDTFHFERGGRLQIALVRNTETKSAGIFLDEPSRERLIVQHRAFLKHRRNPARKTPRAWTPEVTSSPNPDIPIAVYMLHGLYPHAWFGKEVSDIAGIGGQGGISNKGKLAKVHTKDGREIRSTPHFRAETEAKNIADPPPDFLIHRPEFRLRAADIVAAMCTKQREYFKDTLIPALHGVEGMGAAAFMDAHYDPAVDPINQPPYPCDLALSDSDSEEV